MSDEKAKTKNHSPRRTAVIKRIVESAKKGVIPVVKDIMLDAGYAPATAQHPSKITRSEEYMEAMQRNGLTTDKIAKAVEDLVEATVIKEREFKAEEQRYTVQRKDGPKTLTRYIKMSDEEIRAIIEAAKGCKIVKIINQRYQKIAYYTAPERQSRKGGLEIVHKAQGLNQPEKHVHEFDDELDAEEQKLYDQIFNANGQATI